MRISCFCLGVSCIILSTGMAGCTVGPNYHRPSAPTTPSFKEAAGWRPSAPADVDHTAWWTMFDDPVLDSLEQRVATSNQTVKEAEAAYRQAHAIVDEARASFFPTVGATVQATRGNTSGGSGATSTGVTTATSLEGTPTSASSSSSGATTSAVGLLEASWVPDIWGKVRRTVESDKALAQASAAQLANIKLATQAALAEDYFELRVLDEEEQLYRDTVADFEKDLRLTQFQYQEGTQPLSTVVSAKTQLLNAKSLMISIQSTRAMMEHAIAVLTGAPPADLTIAVAPLSRRVPVAPAGVPTALLERRPDIAFAERQMASSNALIGVAISAYYPDLTLTAQGGGSNLAALSGGPAALWSLGANVADTLIDFGARRAQVHAARAVYDESVATYRQTVLTAFQGVEDELAALRVFQQQEEVALQAEAAARQAVQLDLDDYRDGTVDYTTVLVAQTVALASSVSVLVVLQERLQASVLLVENLGGGWSATDLPKS